MSVNLFADTLTNAVTDNFLPTLLTYITYALAIIIPVAISAGIIARFYGGMFKQKTILFLLLATATSIYLHSVFN